jgi:hypothetical protein
MMNQPLRRVDPLGRSAAPTETRPTATRAPVPMTGSVWPICGGSVRAIVDTCAPAEVIVADQVGGADILAGEETRDFVDSNRAVSLAHRCSSPVGLGPQVEEYTL